MAAELRAVGVPIPVIAEHRRELITQRRHIAVRSLEFASEHVFARDLDAPDRRTDVGATEAVCSCAALAP
ncbi:hypothetical protein OHB00_25350 [Streptomyces sp. NBC_00631]|uniref:hypothetical protein n=1 Tax=Streptomyces sp. NBC_00631 TaxID=2975793 RepID=UPI0030E1A511